MVDNSTIPCGPGFWVPYPSPMCSILEQDTLNSHSTGFKVIKIFSSSAMKFQLLISDHKC